MYLGVISKKVVQSFERGLACDTGMGSVEVVVVGPGSDGVGALLG